MCGRVSFKCFLELVRWSCTVSALTLIARVSKWLQPSACHVSIHTYIGDAEQWISDFKLCLYASSNSDVVSSAILPACVW